MTTKYHILNIIDVIKLKLNKVNMDLNESFTEMNIEYIELYEETDSKLDENNVDPFGIWEFVRSFFELDFGIQ
jgi:hypothetical protein